MIPRDLISEWRQHAPWVQDALVEQDLVISRALVEIFRVPELAAGLAFRGGTALNKLHLAAAFRYSEDIDLVQVRPAPIGATFDQIRAVLDPWLGAPRRQIKEGRVNLVYRFESEDDPPLSMRLKIEINSREHFSELGLLHLPFEVPSRWFTGSASLTTFALDELLGTKLRALYQRKKGRDLFDLWHALRSGLVAPDRILACFSRYMREEGHSISRAQFEQNLAEKALDRAFREDIVPLLRQGVSWDPEEAMRLVLEQLIAHLPGEPWRG